MPHFSRRRSCGHPSTAHSHHRHHHYPVQPVLVVSRPPQPQFIQMPHPVVLQPPVQHPPAPQQIHPAPHPQIHPAPPPHPHQHTHHQPNFANLNKNHQQPTPSAPTAPPANYIHYG